MNNNDIMTLTLTKKETIDMSLAITAIILDMSREINDADDDRKEILLHSIEKWELIRDKIRAQVKDQDAE